MLRVHRENVGPVGVYESSPPPINREVLAASYQQSFGLPPTAGDINGIVLTSAFSYNEIATARFRVSVSAWLICQTIILSSLAFVLTMTMTPSSRLFSSLTARCCRPLRLLVSMLFIALSLFSAGRKWARPPILCRCKICNG